MLFSTENCVNYGKIHCKSFLPPPPLFNNIYCKQVLSLIHINLTFNFFSTGKSKTASLHMADDTIVITPDHLHVDQVTEIVGAASAGAISLFVGKFKITYFIVLIIIIINIYIT